MAKDSRFELRLSQTNKIKWEAAALAHGLSLADWITKKCNDDVRTIKESPIPKVRTSSESKPIVATNRRELPFGALLKKK